MQWELVLKGSASRLSGVLAQYVAPKTALLIFGGLLVAASPPG